MNYILFLLLSIPFSVLCQENINTFTPNDLDNYVSIYMESKLNTNSVDKYILPLLNKYKVNENRYGEIIKSTINNIEFVLQENEILMMHEIQFIDKEIKTNKEDQLKIICKRNNFPFEIYLKIDNYAKTNTAFQKKLSKYFSKKANTYEK